MLWLADPGTLRVSRCLDPCHDRGEGSTATWRLTPLLFPSFLLRSLVLSKPSVISLPARAIALISPFLYKGFGLPIIEAMACGCPVMTCRNSFLPEVAGEAALYVDEQDELEIVTALEKVLNSDIRRPLIEAGFAQARKFSWSTTAQQVE